MKRFLKTIGIIILIFFILSIASGFIFYSIYSGKPSVKFLMSNSGFRTPGDYTKKEVFIAVNSKKIPVILYRHRFIKSDKYFMLQHGLSPDGHKHPKIDLFAASICDATGMNVVIPYIKGSITGGSLVDAYNRIADVYISLVKEYPGRYRAFGACIGANILLMALNRVPTEIYPEKMLLLGPFADGKALLAFYNKLGNMDEIDIMVKMAITLNMDIYTESEKELIRKAISSSKPGTTDRSEMKKILGEKLFNDIAVVKLHHNDFESISGKTMLGKYKKIPNCKYFILHSKTDNIIPYFEGRDLAKFMRKSGISNKFLGTEILSHAENKITVTGFLKEMKYLIKFFDELFEGDI